LENPIRFIAKGFIIMASSARPVALITGASSGIGAELAREATKDGHDLVLVARRREPMEALAAELHGRGTDITVIATDLGKPGGAAELMKIVEDRGLVIDTLINNAGLGDTGPFDQANPQRISSMLQVNVVALTELTRLVLPKMVARKRGKVLLLASIAAFQPGPDMAVYYATKSYVLSFGRAIGYELRRSGVTVTTLCPGPTASEFGQVANSQGLLEGPMPVMTAAEVARQGYAALKAGRPLIITGLLNKIIAMTTRFTPTSVLLMIAGHLNSRGGTAGGVH
jgi:short-subunit dehydrogenase